MSDKVFFSVGPTQIYPTIREHIDGAFELDVPSISHRSQQYMDIQAKAVHGLRKFMAIPETFEVFFVSSGTEAMERSIQNCVEKKSGHIVYGAFSKRWKKISEELGRETEDLTVSDGEVPDLVQAAFSKDVELIAVTHNETSTGGMIPFSSITEFRKSYPDALIGVDIVSSAPSVRVDWEAIDLAFFSVQKGFGLPSGLGVMLVGPRAFAKAVNLTKKMSVGSYHSFQELKKYADKMQTPETPNVLEIFLLGKIIEDMYTFGIDAIRFNTERRAERLYSLLDNSSFTPCIKNVGGRSLTTIAALAPDGSKPVIEALKSKGLVVGSGYGENKEKHIRIGNFPSHSDEDFERLLEALRVIQ